MMTKFLSNRNAWFVIIKSQQFNLGPDRDAALLEFHELMLMMELTIKT